MKDILIVGIDPAPGKGSAVVEIQIKDGKFSLRLHGVLKAETLWEKLENWKDEPSVLIAWDAPLTGPSDIEEPWEDYSLTRRKIEALFAKKDDKQHGISVRGYGGCPHWTISQRMFGLPKLHPKHTGGAYNLIESNSQYNTLTGCFVVEVHPAIAIWQWLKQENIDNYDYKKDKNIRNQFCSYLFNLWKEKMNLDVASIFEEANKSDDILDALVAAVLAYAWVNYPNQVTLIGNVRTGAWLLPQNSQTKSWAQKLS